jgi:hypothetical protein
MRTTTETPNHTTNQAPGTGPKPRSAAQIAASRANGAKSRGPVTPDGKKISAQNAQRHGILAGICTIAGEAPENFAAMLADLYKTWAPTDEHERCLVDTLGMAVWRRARIAALESAGITLQVAKVRAASNRPDAAICTATQYRALTSLAQETHTFELLHRYEKAFTRMFERAARSLMAYRKFRQELPTVPETDPDHEPQLEPQPRPATQPEPEIQNQRNEPEPLPNRPLTRPERRLQKWQKAHPRATQQRP